MKKSADTLKRDAGKVAGLLLELVGTIPESPEAEAADPRTRARRIARTASMKAAGISGAMAIPSGPLGVATIVPDLLAIWRIQRQMVADIAACFGQSGALGRESMVYCMFKHGGAAAARDLVVRAGGRYLIQQTSVAALRRVLEKVGLRVTEQVIGRTLSRFLPLIGAVGVGAYAYYDTSQVAATAVEVFASRPQIAGDKAEALPVESE